MQRQHPFPQFRKFVATQLRQQELDPNVAYSLKLAQEICHKINSETPIVSCNLPTQGKENEVLVLHVQNEVDKIFEKEGALLDKIMEAAKIVQVYAAGNCQHKVFLAIKVALELFKEKGLATLEHTPSLRIQYCDGKEGHFFLIINEQAICDPWADLSFPGSLLKSVIAQDVEGDIYDGPIRDYFLLGNDWRCFQAEHSDEKQLSFCQASTNATFKYAPQADNTPLVTNSLEETGSSHSSQFFKKKRKNPGAEPKISEGEKGEPIIKKGRVTPNGGN